MNKNLRISSDLFKYLTRLTFLVAFSTISFWSVAQNCSVNAGVPQTICDNEQLFLQGSTSGLEQTGNIPTWSQVSGPSVTIVDPVDLNTEVTNISGGNTYTFRLSSTGDDGTLVIQDVVITVNVISESNAGSDASYCPGSESLSGNSLGTSETGEWTTDNTVGVTINDPTSPTSEITISGNNSGNATLTWTITNSNGCTSSDDVVITNQGGVSPVYAGADQNLDHCFSSTQSTSMSASYGGSGINGQEGVWTTISGPNLPSYSNVNSNSTDVHGLIEGTYVLRWTVAGSCVSGDDEVTIIVPAPTADITEAEIVGGNQIFCDNRTTTVIEGYAPLYINETVEWVQTAGPLGVTIEDSTSSVTEVTGLDGTSTYEFSYTITNDTTGCEDACTITVSYFNDAPTITILDDHIYPNCDATDASIPFTFTGSGSNQYSIISGPVISGVTYPTEWASTGVSPALIEGLDSIGTYNIQFRRYTSVNVSCGTAYDDVQVTTSQSPTASNAGTDQIVDCNVDTTELIGNTPAVGVGTWSQVYGPTTVTLSDIYSPHLVVRDLGNGIYRFRWLITGGSACGSNSDDVRLLVSDNTPTAVDAGDPQSVCTGTPV